MCVCVYEKGKLCACAGEGFVDCSVFVSWKSQRGYGKELCWFSVERMLEFGFGLVLSHCCPEPTWNGILVWILLSVSLRSDASTCGCESVNVYVEVHLCLCM